MVTIGPLECHSPELRDLLERGNLARAADDLADGLTAPEWLVGAWDGAKLVGMAWARTERHYEPEPVCVLHQVLVDDRRRREGIGAHLIEAVLAEGRRRGARRMRLLMHPPQRREEHRAFYRSLGFGVDPENPDAMVRRL